MRKEISKECSRLMFVMVQPSMVNRYDSGRSTASLRSLQKVDWLILAARRAASQLDVPLQNRKINMYLLLLLLFFILSTALARDKVYFPPDGDHYAATLDRCANVISAWYGRCATGINKYTYH